jgi:hypothetical protein
MRSRGIALLILNLGARSGLVVSTTPRPLYPQENPIPLVQEAGWASGPVWMCAKNLALTGIRSPDCPTCIQLLYRLNYPAEVFSRNGGKSIERVCIITGKDKIVI